MIIRYDTDSFLAYLKQKYPDSYVYQFLRAYPERMVLYSKVFGYSFTPREWEAIARVEQLLKGVDEQRRFRYYRLVLRKELYDEYVEFVCFRGVIRPIYEYLAQPELIHDERLSDELLQLYEEIIVKRLMENLGSVLCYLHLKENMSVDQLARHYFRLMDMVKPGMQLMMMNALSELWGIMEQLEEDDDKGLRRSSLWDSLGSHDENDARRQLQQVVGDFRLEEAQKVINQFLLTVGEILADLDHRWPEYVSEHTYQFIKKYRRQSNRN